MAFDLPALLGLPEALRCPVEGEWIRIASRGMWQALIDEVAEVMTDVEL